MRNLKLASMTSALALAACFTTMDNANAQAIYGGGSTLASKVYRQLFDCWGIPAGTVPAACPSSIGRVQAPSSQILYAPVGSGKGKQAFVNHDGSSNASFGLGPVATTNTVPYTSTYLSAYGYPTFHFAGSDDVLVAGDITKYGANAHGVNGNTSYGQILQIPAFSTPVAIMVNGKDGNGTALTINAANYNPPGAVSKLNLSRQAYCGIFSGHITKWDNPILTALNGGTPLGHGQITVVHRQDGSGTTFLTTQALIAQCGYSVLNGPNNESDPTVVSYAFPFTDRVTATTGTLTAAPILADNLINWPDLTTDQFGHAIPLPAGAIYAQSSGSGGVTSLVQSTNGAIGYVSPDFVQPVVPTGPITANLQDQNDLVNATGQFHAPTPGNTTIAMSTANYVAVSANLTDPLTWSTYGVSPDPAAPNAYPIAGFTWLDLYQCYEPTAGTEVALLAYLQWHYTSPEAQNILAANGFAPVPFGWFNDAAVLAVVSSSSFSYPGVGSCATVNPPGA